MLFFFSQGGNGSITHRKSALLFMCVRIPVLRTCTCCMHVHTDMCTHVCVCVYVMNIRKRQMVS